MRYCLLISLFLGCVEYSLCQTNAVVLANKIAQKMKDSLSLSSEQKNQVYSINMGLHNQKMNARQQYAGSDSVGIKIQQVENTRDSLYHLVLTEQQFLLYQDKKKNLVNNN